MQIIFHSFETLSSTNDYAKQNLAFFEKGKLHVISAEEQKEGRGRFDRKWHSTIGGLYASFCLDHFQGEPLSYLYLMALSVWESLKKRALDCTMKWPNDLLVNQEKIAGMLLEVTSVGIVLGLGLNVNQEKEALADVGQKATSLFLCSGKKESVEMLLKEIAEQFSLFVDRYHKEGFSPFA